MPRNQSFFHTKEQYRNQTKTVTRRLGWKFAKVGDIANGVEKAQGLKKGERIVLMGQHRFIDLRWEPLRRMLDEPEYGEAEVIKEGFPEMSPGEFVTFFCKSMGCDPETLVHRMEYAYLTRYFSRCGVIGKSGLWYECQYSRHIYTMMRHNNVYPFVQIKDNAIAVFDEYSTVKKLKPTQAQFETLMDWCAFQGRRFEDVVDWK